MHQKHIELDGLATVQEALIAMRDNKSNVVIVKKRNEHDAWGIVLLSDIVKKVLAKDKAPERVNVYEIMSKPVIPIAPDLDVRYVARLFDRFGLSNAPVIDNDQVLGIISYEDMVFKGLCELID
jgi:CBS domain-containing protein